MKLIYLPLESYIERYTYFMSAKDGWAESFFKQKNINFVRVEPSDMTKTKKIKDGSVVDAYERSLFAMKQIEQVINMLKNNEIADEDVIYVEDFWHPSIEALFYIRTITKKKFKIGCFIHAQSIDDSDFTFEMKDWIRKIEIGYSYGYDYVFTCSPILKKLAMEAGFQEKNIHVTGLPYNSTRLLEQLKEGGFEAKEKQNYVLFSSRFDTEKNPMFFLDLVERCPDINFKLVKPREKLSNSIEVINRAKEMLKKCSNFTIVDTSKKQDYYNLLSAAKVQFNCAIQDWVSWTLLEAITFGCIPLYPNWKDFPNELHKNTGMLIYNNQDLDDAERKLRFLMSKENSVKFDLDYVVQKHDNSWNMKLKKMGFYA